MSDLDFSDWFQPADEAHVKRERAKAREMRKSHWWKNLRGRGKCYYCHVTVAPSELTMDHVVPVIRGGRSTKGNLVASCKVCNDAKKYRLPIEWQDWLNARRREVREGTQVGSRASEAQVNGDSKE